MCPRDTKKEEETIAETASAVATESPYEEKALIATHDMCHYCFDVIGQELQKRGNTDRKNHKFSHKNTDPINSLVAIDEILPTLDASCPLFVTWDKKVLNKRRPLRTEHTEGEENKHIYELRGCIGTLAPRPLITALREYAILSAFRDGRFEPMRPDEVSSLRVAVSLLVNYEDCEDAHDWIVGVHGILLKFQVGGTHYNATYLPEVAYEQGWTQEQTIRSLIRKSGFYGNPREVLSPNNESLQCIRYQSSKKYLTYDEYVQRCSRNSTNNSPPLASSSTGTMTFVAPTSDDVIENDNNIKTRQGWRSCLPF